MAYRHVPTARAGLALSIIGTAALAVAGTVRAQTGEATGGRMAAWLDQAGANAPEAAGMQTLAYGDDPLQTMVLWPARGTTRPAPLIVFVHGGGWKRGDKANATGRWKAVHFPGEGYAFASINYRLVPDATVEQQASDVARAVRNLIDRAKGLGIDPGRIVLMGHSAGAHLVALVGTDPRYLRGAGLSPRDIAGVVPIDGAAYDVPAQMSDGPAIMQRTYTAAFGSDPARQRRLSPTLQAAAPNAPRFLLLHVQRPDGVRQADGLTKALRAAGTDVVERGYPGEGLRGHREINQRLGDPDYAATADVDRWLAATFSG